MSNIEFEWETRNTIAVTKLGNELGELSCLIGKWVYYLPESELFLTAKQLREIAEALDEQNSNGEK